MLNVGSWENDQQICVEHTTMCDNPAAASTTTTAMIQLPAFACMETKSIIWNMLPRTFHRLRTATNPRYTCHWKSSTIRWGYVTYKRKITHTRFASFRHNHPSICYGTYSTPLTLNTPHKIHLEKNERFINHFQMKMTNSRCKIESNKEQNENSLTVRWISRRKKLNLNYRTTFVCAILACAKNIRWIFFS